jgi:hypothetical protein
LGATWVRSIVYDLDRFQTRVAELPDGVGSIALLNSETLLPGGDGAQVGNETEPDWEARWEQIITEFARRFGNDASGHPVAVECLNEWDLHGIPAERAVRAVQIAAPLLQEAGLVCLFGSVASGDWPQQLKLAMQQLDDETRGLLGGICFHPYGKPAGGVPDGWSDQPSLTDTVMQAYAFANPDGVGTPRPLWLTEFGLNRTDVDGDVELQADYVSAAFSDLGALSADVLAVACLFCWNDTVGAPGEAFGLRPAEGEPTYPAWAAFQACAFPPADEEPQVPLAA